MTKFKTFLNSTLTLVFPIYNEENSVAPLISSLNKFIDIFPKKTDIIFVDDGSTDKTVDNLLKSKNLFSFKVISLSKNFGHQTALLAGLQESKGDIVVTLDSDLQHPISLIPEMIKLHDNGYDIVHTKRIDDKSITLTKKLLSKSFYKIINFLSNTSILENGSDFRSMNRKALTALLSMPEQRKFLRGMIQWVGFKSIIIPFQAEERKQGKSKYSLFKMLSLALRGLTSFSTKPLYLSGIFSLILFFLAFIYAIYVIYVRFWGTGVVEGWASVLFAVLIIGGFLALFLGLLGVYVAAIYDETKNRPDYFVSQRFEKSKK